ncbi:hypothetical protein B0T21DRAFT_48832 [Apiosordaria backusii]|uniref:C2H2-type domain-containing protein n=1 Tax=Apiosordaria backusii TaxID=314023 RepID=A0AA40ASH3_9PEZI|nr:hypothetical protein B0T21DRAFT_48832 [Apiosordaria backusii]
MEPPGGLPSPSPSSSISGARRMLPMNSNRLQSDGPSLTPSFSSTTEGSMKQVINTLPLSKQGVSAHVCNICKPPKTFTTAEHLSRHQLSHGEPKFPCHGCDRVFHREDLLLSHLDKNEHDHEKVQPPPSVPSQNTQLPTPASSVAPPPSLAGKPRPSFKKSSKPTYAKARDYSFKPLTDLLPTGIRDTKSKTSNKENKPSRSATQKVVSGRAGEPKPPPNSSAKDPKPPLGVIGDDFENDVYDDETDYSDGGSVEGVDVDAFQSKFAETLASDVRKFDADFDKRDGRKLFDSLPDSLVAFALSLGQPGSTQAQRDVMYLVHKFRHDISNRFKGIIEKSIKQRSIQPPGKQDSNSESTSSRIRDWLATGVDDNIGNEPITENASRPPEETHHGNQHRVGVPVPPDKCEYDAVFSSASYKWLLSSIAQTLHRSPSSPLDAINVIGSHIRGAYRDCQKKKLSRRLPSKTHEMYLLADLDLVAFLNDQYTDCASPKSRTELLCTAITLTGFEVDAQALPCAEYIQQTWPITGIYVMNAICSALDSQASCTEKLPDRSEVTANLIQEPIRRRLGIRIKAKGTADFLAEVGEIFGWLTAALRASPDQDQLAWCIPYLHHSGKARNSISEVWEVRFKITKATQGISEDKLGQCWHGMFRNAVIVKGFPIPHRPSRNTGLEIPLHMAAGLMDTPKMHEFLGRYYLKGFSTMLAPVELIGGVVLWHLYHNRSGRRISYCDALNSGSKARISLKELHTSRHIIGWCSEALCMAGDQDANYSIRNSALPFPGREFALEKVSFSVGNFITGGCQFSIGRKDIPLHITKQGYVAKLRWIDQKYLIFWDEEDKRGWLVNGSSALLHLVRASLEHCQSDKFSSEFLFDFKAFKEPATRFRSDSAVDALLDRDNRNLWLYREEKTQEKTIYSSGRLMKQIEKTATYTTLEGKIVEVYESLEKLIDYQAHSAADSKGLNAKPRGSGRLEGWDFKDIAMTKDPVSPRVATLPDYGKTWTSFAKEIRAVALLGRGFGDIIKPNLNTSDLADKPTPSVWHSMPAGKGLLGACLADLKEITESQGTLEILDKLFKSEEVNPDSFPLGGVIFGLHTRLKRSVRGVLPGPSQTVAKDSQDSTSTTSYSDDTSSAPPSLIANRRSAGGLPANADSDPTSQDTLPTTPGICRTPSRSSLGNLAPSIAADDDASPDDDLENTAAGPAGLGLRSIKKLMKRPREDDESQYEDGGGKGGKRRKLMNLVRRAPRDAGPS